jgi:hypothetical protein
MPSHQVALMDLLPLVLELVAPHVTALEVAAQTVCLFINLCSTLENQVGGSLM